MRPNRIGLGNHSHSTRFRLQEHPVCDTCNELAFDSYFAGVGAFQTAYAAQRRRLSAAARTKENEQFASSNLEADVMNGPIVTEPLT